MSSGRITVRASLAIDGFAGSGNRLVVSDAPTGLYRAAARKWYAERGFSGVIAVIRLFWPILFAASALCVMSTAPCRAADAFDPAQRAEIVRILRDALATDPSILRDAVAALQTAEHQQQQVDASTRVAANAGKIIDPADPVAGDPKGDVTIVEFFDVRCPYCKRLDPPMAELLARDHHVRLIYKDLPVLGPPSLLGARALLAAQKQGRYEPMRDALMRATAPITEELIRAEAQKLGLDRDRLTRDMDDPVIAARLNSNLALAESLGIQGTPALVIGGMLIPGAVDLNELTRAVAEARSKDGALPRTPPG